MQINLSESHQIRPLFVFFHHRMVLVTGALQTEEIVAATTMFVLYVVSLLPRAWITCTFGWGHANHVVRKPFLAYWKFATLSAFVMHMFILFGLFSNERTAGRFINWTRWVGYAAMSVGIVGMQGEFQLHDKFWTTVYAHVPLLFALLTAGVNAFVPDNQSRNMLLGLGGASIGFYVICLFWFDYRTRDVCSRFISLLYTAAVAVVIAMFVCGHANLQSLGIVSEYWGYYASEVWILLVVAGLWKYHYCPADLWISQCNQSCEDGVNTELITQQ